MGKHIINFSLLGQGKGSHYDSMVAIQGTQANYKEDVKVCFYSQC
jgi:hypothetical protein